MKRFYEILYRWSRAPWEGGPRTELVDLVTSGRIPPCRAIDLGCGTGANAVYLAQYGFDVTGVDFAEAAIARARTRAQAAGMEVAFVVDDLTDLRHVRGSFDFLLDYGVLDDLRLPQREAYVQTVLALARPGSRYLLWGFEYPMRRWERLVPFYDIPFAEGEIAARFGSSFAIECIARSLDWSSWPPGCAAYLMTRIE